MFTWKVLVLGAGELASAIAHRLFRCGFPVVMTDLPQPLAVRRAVSFCTAVVQGEAEVEGVVARRWSSDDVGALASFDWSSIPVFVEPVPPLLTGWRPQVVVDARLLKNSAHISPSLAPLVIGLGPGMAAGRDVHVVIETNRGHDLGRIILHGPASADTGVPGSIGGFSHERVLRAPVAGTFEPLCVIGDQVLVGHEVARVGGAPVRAAIPGVVRGLLFSGTPVTAGLKIGDIDPRGHVEHCFTLSDKARAISGAVLEAILGHLNRPAS